MRFLATALFIFSAWNLQADEARCFANDTPRQCLQRLITTRAYETAQASLGAANTGPTSVSSPIRSAAKDFLSVASAHIDGSTVKDSGAALTIDYNFPQAILGSGRQLNLEAEFPNPVASPAVAAATTAPLSLSRGDDVAVALSYNLVTRHFGRGFGGNRELFDSMLLALAARTAPATASVPATSLDTTFAQILPDAAARANAMAEFETAAISALPAAAANIVNDLTQLANNQPQIFATYLNHHRAKTVGANKHGFRATWEIGTDNLNSFRRSEGRDCEARGNCLEALELYKARTVREHRTGHLALAIEYGITSTNDTGVAAITELPTKTLTYMATYGAEMTSFSGHPGRFDLALTYDGHKTTRGFTTSGFAAAAHVLSAPTPQGFPTSTLQSAAVVTFTQPLSQNLSGLMSVASLDHDDWTPAVPFSGSFPSPPRPVHTHHRETFVQGGISIKLPPFSRPSPKGSCCCK